MLRNIFKGKYLLLFYGMLVPILIYIISKINEISRISYLHILDIDISIGPCILHYINENVAQE